VCGGYGNVAAFDSAFVGGGGRSFGFGVRGNAASNEAATVCGGVGNVASGRGAFVGGGGWDGITFQGNLAGGDASVVGGGLGNTASHQFASVVGGIHNLAGGVASFAAGANSQALHDGSFVWGDWSTNGVVSSTTTNQFTARAAGGTRFFSDSAATVGVELAPGANSWSALSDRNAKENFAALNYREVLDNLDAVPVTSWNLKSQPDSVRHIGPMAQDFHAAFGVGEDDRHISTSDADGVAFAAIKGLHELVKEQQRQMEQLRRENAILAETVKKLSSQVEQVSDKVDAMTPVPTRAAFFTPAERK
jgi:hypothetical protein